MSLAQSYSIAFKGLKPGPHAFDFEVDGALFEACPAAEILGGDCAVHVCLDRSETQLVADVRITGSVAVACDRCLEACEVPIDFEGRLLVKFSDEMREYDGEIMWLSPAESEVDLTQYIYESIVLSLPFRRVHPDGGCNPAMLEKFRIVSGEEFASIEAAAEACVRSALEQEELTKLAALRVRLAAERQANPHAEYPEEDGEALQKPRSRKDAQPKAAAPKRRTEGADGKDTGPSDRKPDGRQ